MRRFWLLLLLSARASACPAGYFITPDGAHCAGCKRCEPLSVLRACGQGGQDAICGVGMQVYLEVQGLTRINTTLWWTTYGNISSVQVEYVNATVGKIPCNASMYRDDSGVCQRCQQCGARAVEVLPCRAGDDRVCQGYILWELEAAGVTGIANASLLPNYNNVSWRDASQYLVQKMPCWPGYYRGDDGMCYGCRTCKINVEIEVSKCDTISDTMCVPNLKVMLGIDGLSWRDRVDLINKLSRLFNLSSIEFEDASSLEVSAPLQVIAEVNGIERADASLIMAALNRSGILAKTVEVNSANEITISKLPCPTGQFRADLDALCVACQVCTSERIEVRPCTTQSDRLCGQSLNVGVNVDGVALWQINSAILVDQVGLVLLGNGSIIPAFEYNLHEEVDISVARTPCKSGEEYSDKEQNCHACTLCKPYEEELRGCGATQDRVCRGKIQVDLAILGAAGIDTSSWDLSRVQADLAVALDYSGGLVNTYSLQYARPNISISVTPLPCPPNTFINVSIPACQECTRCAGNQYASPGCAGMQDSVCHACSPCAPWDNLIETCGDGHDTICEGLLEAGLRIDNVTSLDAELLQALLANAVRQAPGVDPGYLDRWMGEHKMVEVFSPYEIEIEALNCTTGFYQDNQTSSCKRCSRCANEAYMMQECAWDTDTICGVCDVCVMGEYEACPCGIQSAACPTGNRVCYAYPTQSWEMEVLWLSQYDRVCLETNGYIQRFLQSIRTQLMAGDTGIASYETVLIDGEVVTLSDGSMRGLGVRVYPLFPNCTASQGGLYMHNITIYLHDIYAQIPNSEQAFETLFERALKFADVKQGNRRQRRSLLQQQDTLLNCPEDTYPYDYGGSISVMCVPCLDDPVPTANDQTPPALRWIITSHPCPSGFARTCFGGTTTPVCVIRNGAAALLSSRAALTSITCPTQQLLVLEPTTLNAICVGAPCYPGTTGQPGKCVPCAQGTYKPTTGSVRCTDCQMDTFNPSTQSTDITDCNPCPANQSSSPGAADCLCDPGYGNITCDPCEPGSFKLHQGNEACRPCPSGSYSQSTAGIACDACAMGTFAPSYGLTICSRCDLDSYQNHLGGSACLVCGHGFISNEQRLACRPCPAGTYEKMGDCLPCEANQVSQEGQAMCERCPPGSGYLDGTCAPCLHGYVQSVIGVCEQCPANTYFNGLTCNSCPPRTFQANPGQDLCEPCAPGSFGDACTLCLPGTYSTGYSLTECRGCERGKYTQNAGETSSLACVNCAAGTYWINTNCVDCPVNTESPPAATAITECLAVEGSYALPGQAGIPCPQNTYCVRGAMQPSPCPAGSSSKAGSRACTQDAQNNNQMSRLLMWDWIVPPIWGFMVLLGVGCVLRNRSLLSRRRLPVLPVKLRYSR